MQKVIYGTTHFPHGWLKLRADFNNIFPTLDAGIAMQHTILLEGKVPMVVWSEEMKIGHLGNGNSQSKTVYSTDSECPALTATMGEKGNTMPYIMVEDMILGHLDENSNQRYVVYDKDGEAPTLQSAMGTGGGQAPYIAIDEQNMTARSDVVGTLTTDGSSPKHNNRVMDVEWRIRKITPREAFRLMDFSDEDFDKAAAVQSNCQLYKEAGNSIVKNVIVAALGQLFPGKEDVYKRVDERHGILGDIAKPTLNACSGGGHEPKILESSDVKNKTD